MNAEILVSYFGSVGTFTGAVVENDDQFITLMVAGNEISINKSFIVWVKILKEGQVATNYVPVPVKQRDTVPVRLAPLPDPKVRKGAEILTRPSSYVLPLSQLPDREEEDGDGQNQSDDLEVERIIRRENQLPLASRVRETLETIDDDLSIVMDDIRGEEVLPEVKKKVREQKVLVVPKPQPKSPTSSSSSLGSIKKKR